MENIYQIVVEVYKNALENGYEMDKLTALEVAEEMTMYCADLEHLEPEEVESLVLRYRSTLSG